MPHPPTSCRRAFRCSSACRVSPGFACRAGLLPDSPCNAALVLRLRRGSIRRCREAGISGEKDVRWWGGEAYAGGSRKKGRPSSPRPPRSGLPQRRHPPAYLPPLPVAPAPLAPVAGRARRENVFLLSGQSFRLDRKKRYVYRGTVPAIRPPEPPFRGQKRLSGTDFAGRIP